MASWDRSSYHGCRPETQPVSSWWPMVAARRALEQKPCLGMRNGGERENGEGGEGKRLRAGGPEVLYISGNVCEHVRVGVGGRQTDTVGPGGARSAGSGQCPRFCPE